MTQYNRAGLRLGASAAVGLAWLAAAFLVGRPVAAQELTAGAGVADVGEFSSIPIRIESAPNEVDAFGFDVFYDAGALAYAGTFVEGELAQPFTFFSVTNPAPGQLRVAAFSISEGIAAGTSGLLVAVDFEVLACPPGGAVITIGALVDDVAGWEVSPGVVDCPVAVLSVSDTALRFASDAGASALRVRNAGNGPLDWTASAIVGAEWLSVAPEMGHDDGELSIAFAANNTGAAREGTIRIESARSSPAFIDVTVIQSADAIDGAGDIVVGTVAGNVGDLVTVAIGVASAPTEASAFGIDFLYDASVLRHTGEFTPGELVEGFTLFAITEPEPGRLRLGAVAIDTPISLGESGTLATIEFEILACAEDATEISVGALIDHVESWETAAGMVECGAPVLVVSSTTVRVSAGTGSATVTISNAGEDTLEWTAEVILGTWLSVEPRSGSGDGMLTIRFDANHGTQSRGGEIWIASNARTPDSVTVEVIQAAPMNAGEPMGCAAGGRGVARTSWVDWVVVAFAVALVRQWPRSSVKCPLVRWRHELRRE